MTQPADYPTRQDCIDKFDNSGLIDLDPLDDPDPFDPTGYYARQAKHRAEMLPFLAVMWGVCIVFVAGFAIWKLVT